jgi:hypothetical protein
MSAPTTVAGVNNKLDAYATATSNKIIELEETVGSMGATINKVEADQAQSQADLSAQVQSLSSALAVALKRLDSVEGTLASLSGEAVSVAPPAPLFGAFIAPFKGVAEDPAETMDPTKKSQLKVTVPAGGALKLTGQLLDITQLALIMHEVHSWGLANDNKWPYGWWVYMFTSEAQSHISTVTAADCKRITEEGLERRPKSPQEWMEACKSYVGMFGNPLDVQMKALQPYSCEPQPGKELELTLIQVRLRQLVKDATDLYHASSTISKGYTNAREIVLARLMDCLPIDLAKGVRSELRIGPNGAAPSSLTMIMVRDAMLKEAEKMCHSGGRSKLIVPFKKPAVAQETPGKTAGKPADTGGGQSKPSACGNCGKDGHTAQQCPVADCKQQAKPNGCRYGAKCYKVQYHNAKQKAADAAPPVTTAAAAGGVSGAPAASAPSGGGSSQPWRRTVTVGSGTVGNSNNNSGQKQ